MNNFKEVFIKSLVYRMPIGKACILFNGYKQESQWWQEYGIKADYVISNGIDNLIDTQLSMNTLKDGVVIEMDIEYLTITNTEINAFGSVAGSGSSRNVIEAGSVVNGKDAFYGYSSSGAWTITGYDVSKNTRYNLRYELRSGLQIMYVDGVEKHRTTNTANITSDTLMTLFARSYGSVIGGYAHAKWHSFKMSKLDGTPIADYMPLYVSKKPILDQVGNEYAVGSYILVDNVREAATVLKGQPLDGYIESTINTTFSFRNIEYPLDSIIYTKGFYSINDGGAAKYKIVSSTEVNNIDTFLLKNGNVAKLQIEDNMNVLQFGANPIDLGYYNETESSTEQLNIALNCGCKNLDFPNESNFLVTDAITINASSLEVKGNNSNLIVDNNFKDRLDTDSDTGMVNIRDCIDVIWDNLNILGKHTRNINKYTQQMRVLYCSNVYIKNSTFRGPGPYLNKNTVSDLKKGINVNSEYYLDEKYLELDDNINISNLDVFSGAHNVTINNCEFYLSHDSQIGLCYMVRDVQGKGTSNVKFTNNYCEKISHDEIIATGMLNADLSDLYFDNNTFVMYDGKRSFSQIAVSFGSEHVAYPIRNIYARNNNFFLEASLYGIVFEKLDTTSNIDFSNNYVHLEVGENTVSNSVYGMISIYEEGIGETLTIDELNEYNIVYDNIANKSKYLFSNINVSNQKINIEGDVSTVFQNCEYVSNNDINCIGEINTMFANVKNATSNVLTAKVITFLYQFYKDVYNEYNYNNNTITFTDAISSNVFVNRLFLAEVEDGTKINIKNNIHNLINPESSGYFIGTVDQSTLPTPIYPMITLEGNKVYNLEKVEFDFYETVYNQVYKLDRGYIKDESAILSNTWDSLEKNFVTWDYLEQNIVTWDDLENNNQEPIVINTWEELNLNKVSYDYLSENLITYEELEKGIEI